jgi:hypothetical protein
MLLSPESFGSYASQIKDARKQFVGLQGWEPLLGGWPDRFGLSVAIGHVLRTSRPCKNPQCSALRRHRAAAHQILARATATAADGLP